MSITITGASGFVGQNLIEYLEQQHLEVKTLSLRDPNWKMNLDKNSNAIIHLAGKAHDTTNTSGAEEYFRVNSDLTIALFDEFLHSNIQDFFYFSSVKAVADSVSGILKENQQANPLTPYGKSKFEAEQYVLSKKLPEGKRVFVIRPCMIHGPGNKGNLNLLYKVVEKGVPWPLASFENKRSFLGIDNLNFLLVEMLRNVNLPSGVYHFADDETLSTNEIVTLISSSLGKKSHLWKIPVSIIQSCAAIGDFLHLPLDSERLKKLTENYVVSNQKIKSELGINALPLSAKDGLKKTIESFKEKK